MKRALKRLGIAFLVLVVVALLVLFSGRAYLHRRGSGELAEVTKRLDAEDPNWRLEHIEAARESVPPDQNAALAVLRVHDLAEPAWKQHSANITWAFHDPLSNHTPPFEQLIWLAAARNPTADARAAARAELLHRSTGRYTVEVEEIPYATLLPHLEKARNMVALLEYDATLAGLEGDPSRGILAARACLNTGRSVGDEPFLVSQLTRIAGGRIASRSALQTLAWCELKDNPTATADAQLAALQAAVAAEADAPWFLIGMRGERAMAHQVFDGLESGRITPREVFDIFNYSIPGVLRSPMFPLYRGFLPGDHAECLRLMTAYIEAAKLPPHQQMAAFRQIKIPPGPPDEFGYAITRLIIPVCEKIAQAGLRVRAELLSASVAIACERFRMAHGRWPETLDEIPKAILPAIPLDPYDGQPIRYRHLTDGVAVFAIGPEPSDEQQNHNRKPTGPFHGLGFGWRLWNPDLRGLPLPYREPTPNPEEPIDL